MIYKQIIDQARQSNKNILILASPRSGTHALGAELASLSNGKCFGEICQTGRCNDFWAELLNFANQKPLSIAQVVQFTPKLVLAKNVPLIKEKLLIVNIRRKNKIDQFASWVYFRLLDPTAFYGWHNHKPEDTKVERGTVEATELDIEQFRVEQLLDDFFFPDYSLCYEDLSFDSQNRMQVNQFAFPLREMFSNFDFVEQSLKGWTYSRDHFYDKRN